MTTTQAAPTRSVNQRALRSYLLDHLTGGDTAIRVLQDFVQLPAHRPVSELAAQLLPEIEADREVLRQLLRDAGGSTNPLRRMLAWLGGKLSGLKFWRRVSKQLGPFEGIEVLSLGILGKRALWRTLRKLQSDAALYPGNDFQSLIARAEGQYERVEQERVQMIDQAFLKSVPLGTTSSASPLRN